MKKTIAAKKSADEKTINSMISLYCRKKHGTSGHLCDECNELKEYAYGKIAKCPMMETKTFCSSCPIHCYRVDMRQRIKEVMAFSGPWMLLYHPILAIRHLFIQLKSKWRKNT